MLGDEEKGRRADVDEGLLRALEQTAGHAESVN